jgi:hypothetical protein
MFASVRCYFVHQGSIPELARRAHADFAARIATQPRFVAGPSVASGSREYVTISVFQQADEQSGHATSPANRARSTWRTMT